MRLCDACVCVAGRVRRRGGGGQQQAAAGPSAAAATALIAVAIVTPPLLLPLLLSNAKRGTQQASRHATVEEFVCDIAERCSAAVMASVIQLTEGREKQEREGQHVYECAPAAADEGRGCSSDDEVADNPWHKRDHEELEAS